MISEEERLRRRQIIHAARAVAESPRVHVSEIARRRQEREEPQAGKQAALKRVADECLRAIPMGRRRWQFDKSCTNRSRPSALGSIVGYIREIMTKEEHRAYVLAKARAT
jgi:hypothetical protein